MNYYSGEFEKRGFDIMFKFLEMGSQKPNIPTYKKAKQDLIIMMTQKTSGGRKFKKDINWEENFDMTIITIVCESIALYLNGNLEKIENINKGEIEK